MTTHRFPRTALVAALAAGGLVACATNHTPSPEEQPVNASAMSQRDQVAALLRSIETGEPGPIASINPDNYIQHNLAVADGLAGFGAVMQALPPGSARARPVRVFEDGDFVFAHTEYDFFGPKIGFDVFRFEAGLIVEHWDNLQPTPAGPNPSGHTMIDGPTEPTDLDRTDANKALVRAFVTEILIEGRFDRLPAYIDGDHYVQHNPAIGDGLSGLGAAIQEMAARGQAMRFTTLHRVLGEGDFVLAISEGSLGDTPTAFYDLFRVEDGKLVEHWDTIEAIPPRAQWQNSNGKF